MPVEMSPLVVYYNRDLVPRQAARRRGGRGARRGADTWAWGDFEAAARAVAGVDQLGPIKGVSLPADLEIVTAFVRSAGGDVVDDDSTRPA